MSGRGSASSWERGAAEDSLIIDVEGDGEGSPLISMHRAETDSGICTDDDSRSSVESAASVSPPPGGRWSPPSPAPSGGCGGRSRTTFSRQQLQDLRRALAENPYPSSAQYETLAAGLGLEEKSVKLWFQNTRAKQRKQRTHTTPTKPRASPDHVTTLPPKATPVSTQGYVTMTTVMLDASHPFCKLTTRLPRTGHLLLDQHFGLPLLTSSPTLQPATQLPRILGQTHGRVMRHTAVTAHRDAQMVSCSSRKQTRPSQRPHIPWRPFDAADTTPIKGER